MNLKKTNTDIVVFDREQFKQDFSPMIMQETCLEVSTIQQSINADNQSLSVHRKNSSPGFIEGMIQIHLFDLNNSVNTHEKLKEGQIINLAKSILRKHWNLTMTDIFLVLRNGKEGVYGKISYSLEVSQIMLWFESYAEEKVQHFMNNQLDRQQTEQANLDKSHPKIMDAFNKVKSQLPKPKELKPKQGMNLIREKYEGGGLPLVSNEDNYQLNEKKRLILGDNWKELEEQAKRENNG